MSRHHHHGYRRVPSERNNFADHKAENRALFWFILGLVIGIGACALGGWLL